MEKRSRNTLIIIIIIIVFAPSHQRGETVHVENKTGGETVFGRKQTCQGNDVLFVLGLVGLVVRRPPRQRKIPGSNHACAGIFLGSSHTSDKKIDTPVATLPGAWRYRVSAGTGRPVSVYCDWVRWKV